MVEDDGLSYDSLEQKNPSHHLSTQGLGPIETPLPRAWICVFHATRADALGINERKVRKTSQRK